MQNKNLIGDIKLEEKIKFKTKLFLLCFQRIKKFYRISCTIKK